ncbi:hypothetical protein ACHXY8_10260 [Neobacillus thermocopriae]
MNNTSLSMLVWKGYRKEKINSKGKEEYRPKKAFFVFSGIRLDGWDKKERNIYENGKRKHASWGTLFGGKPRMTTRSNECPEANKMIE